jgi:ribosomal protein S18 acetylase RimI-like enzyme
VDKESQTLLSAAKAHAAEKWSDAQLMLCVNAENLPAKRLYAPHGFQTFGLAPRAIKVGDRLNDKKHMCKQVVWRAISRWTRFGQEETFDNHIKIADKSAHS